MIFLIATTACRAADERAQYTPEPINTEVLHSAAYCGAEPFLQEKSGSGDCRRRGIPQALRFEKLNGVVVRKWSIFGSVSNLSIATGCYCLVDE